MGLFRRRKSAEPPPVDDPQLELPLREMVVQCIRRQDMLDAEFAAWTDKLTQWFARQRRRDQLAVSAAMDHSDVAQQAPDIPPSAEFTREQKKAALRQRLRGA